MRAWWLVGTSDHGSVPRVAHLTLLGVTYTIARKVAKAASKDTGDRFSGWGVQHPAQSGLQRR